MHWLRAGSISPPSWYKVCTVQFHQDTLPLMGVERMSPPGVDAKQSLLLSYTHLNWRGPPLVKNNTVSISIHLISAYYL